MEGFKILDADNNSCLKSVAKCITDSFEVSAVNDCPRCLGDEIVMVSLFRGELNCGNDDVVR